MSLSDRGTALLISDSSITLRVEMEGKIENVTLQNTLL